MQVKLKSSVNDVELAMYGSGQDALQSFEQMKKKGVRPDLVTFVSVLSAWQPCWSSG